MATKLATNLYQALRIYIKNNHLYIYKRLAIASFLYIKRLEVKQVFEASSNLSQRCIAANLFASLSHMAG